MSELKTMMTKLGNKRIALIKDETKVENLTNQITVYTTAKDRTLASIDQKKIEVEGMDTLIHEFRDLSTQKTETLKAMKALIDQYDSIPWRPDLREDEKIENSEYPELEKKVAELQVRLNEIPKEVNRIYYRRGDTEE